MIKVSGNFRVTGRYEVELDMTAEEFVALPERKQTELLDGSIDWRDVLQSSETDEIEVWDLAEAE